jgi:hypothetical protein
MFIKNLNDFKKKIGIDAFNERFLPVQEDCDYCYDDLGDENLVTYEEDKQRLWFHRGCDKKFETMIRALLRKKKIIAKQAKQRKLTGV